VILLDDGFQHLAITRNHDVVLLDYNDDPERDTLLPAGRWREPVSAISRADTIVITKVPSTPDKSRLAAFDRIIEAYAPHATRSGCRFEPGRIKPFAGDAVSLNADEIAGLKISAFCGIARPESFFAMLEQLGAKIVARRAFPDHHWYSANDIAEI